MFARSNGGGSGIRTLGGLSPSSVFKTGAFDHSAKPPQHAPHNQPILIRKGRLRNGEFRRVLAPNPFKIRDCPLVFRQRRAPKFSDREFLRDRKLKMD